MSRKLNGFFWGILLRDGNLEGYDFPEIFRTRIGAREYIHTLRTTYPNNELLVGTRVVKIEWKVVDDAQ
jgi:hypothetical protein